jgi:3-oxoacyl-[acyl-carrier protein] reductase
MKLKNKVAVITGSSRGMGKAIALLFSQEGARVVVNYRSNKEEGEKVVAEIKQAGGEAVLIQADLAKPEDIRRLFFETLKTYQTMDILVNNAGIEKPMPFLKLTPEDVDRVLAVNVRALFLTSQEAIKIMQQKTGGKIINTASVRGLDHMGRVNNIDYSASKAAVINFTKTLAKLVAPRITVNAVAPGPTETDMAKTWTEEEKQKKINEIRLGRLIQPSEIAQAVLFLASPQADGITGEILVVDGGYSLGSN